MPTGTAGAAGDEGEAAGTAGTEEAPIGEFPVPLAGGEGTSDVPAAGALGTTGAGVVVAGTTGIGTTLVVVWWEPAGQLITVGWQLVTTTV